MAKVRNVPVEFRADEGKGASRRLRAAGKVPAILYGGGQKPRALQMDMLLAYRYAQNEWFCTSILELDVGNETQKALLRGQEAANPRLFTVLRTTLAPLLRAEATSGLALPDAAQVLADFRSPVPADTVETVPAG